MDAAGWQALGTWATAIVAIAAAMFAWRQVHEARTLREEQAQPQVVAYLDYLDTPASIDLVVRNFGVRPAFDVRLECTPRLRRATGGVEEVKLPDVLPTLAPGQEWRTWFDGGFGRVRGGELDGEDRYDVVVTYRDSGNRRYEMPSALDFGQFRPVVYESRRTMNDLAKSVAELTEAVKRFGEGRDGLSVYVRDGAYKDDQRRRRFEQRRGRGRDL